MWLFLRTTLVGNQGVDARPEVGPNLREGDLSPVARSETVKNQAVAQSPNGGICCDRQAPATGSQQELSGSCESRRIDCTDLQLPSENPAAKRRDRWGSRPPTQSKIIS